MTFEELLAPWDIERFWSEAWERSTLHISGRSERHYDILLSKQEVEDLLFGPGNPAQQELLLCRGAERPVPVSGHSGWAAGSASACAASLRELHRQGYSFLLPSVGRFLPRLAARLARYEDRYKARSIAHLIVSPPNAEGLAPHSDPYGVFALQIAGTKTWSLHEHSPRERLGMGKDHHHLAGTPASSRVRMTAGDLLYLPRGTVHAAASGGDGSIHLAIGLMPPSGVDLISLLSGLAEQDPFFRGYVPYGIGETPDRLDEYQRLFRSRLASLVSEADIRTLLDNRRAERAARGSTGTTG
ncbi:MAG: cupin domain-containing protein [Allosphingosinicella sp.]